MMLRKDGDRDERMLTFPVNVWTLEWQKQISIFQFDTNNTIVKDIKITFVALNKMVKCVRAGKSSDIIVS